MSQKLIYLSFKPPQTPSITADERSLRVVNAFVFGECSLVGVGDTTDITQYTTLRVHLSVRVDCRRYVGSELTLATLVNLLYNCKLK